MSKRGCDRSRLDWAKCRAGVVSMADLPGSRLNLTPRSLRDYVIRYSAGSSEAVDSSYLLPCKPVRFPPPSSLSSSLMSSLVISAPGKVLIAGGYLVLDPAYTGVVASTSSRFYTAITPGNANRIVVRSPQFLNATWSYTWSISTTTAPPSVVVSQVERYLAYGPL